MASQNKTQDRSSRFVWTEQDIVIIKASEETPAADAKHHKPASAAADAPPASSKNDIDNDDQDKTGKP